MNSLPVKWKSKNFLMFILFFQFSLLCMIFFDVPVARQVTGFLYLTIVPGLVIVKLLKLDKQFDSLGVVLFSVIPL